MPSRSRSARAIAECVVDGDAVTLRAGLLSRNIHMSGQRLYTASIRVDGHELLATAIPEVRFMVRRAEPNRRPVGLRPGEGKLLQSERTFTYYGGKPLDPMRWEDRRPEATRWTDAVAVSSDRWGDWTGKPQRQIVEPKPGVRRLIIGTPLTADASFGQLTVTTCYETYEGHPVVRKWIEIENRGDRWLMLDHLTIDALQLAEAYRHATPMTPRELGVQPSVVGFGDAAQSCGLIAASEVPAALRSVSEDGAMGYSDEWFEWVLGPKEKFVSEPVFLYAYAGPVVQTLSAQSTPLDRAIEGPYMRFLHEQVGIAADHAPLYAPQWLTWAVFQFRIDDNLMRTQADLAARAGFAQVLFDDGWQKDRLGTEVDTAKFPDMAATSKYIRARGLSLGLWLSCIRTDESPDLRGTRRPVAAAGQTNEWLGHELLQPLAAVLRGRPRPPVPRVRRDLFQAGLLQRPLRRYRRRARGAAACGIRCCAACATYWRRKTAFG